MSAPAEALEQWRKQINEVLGANDAGLLTLREWERSFMFRVDDRLSNGCELTWQESTTLGYLYKKVSCVSA